MSVHVCMHVHECVHECVCVWVCIYVCVRVCVGVRSFTQVTLSLSVSQLNNAKQKSRSYQQMPNLHMPAQFTIPIAR